MASRQLGVNVHSGELVAETTAALKHARRGGLGRREGCSEVGLGGGRHGVVSVAVRGPVAGPACRACVVSVSEAAAAGSAARRGVRVAGVWSQQ